MNAPNAITTIRILLVPVVVVVLLETEGASALAAAVFALAASTDGLDGYVARSRHEITTFGKVMDPIADKLLIVAALVALVGLDRVAAWVVVAIVARELAVSGLRIVAAQQGLVIAASGLGRVKTVCQAAAVFALIAASDPDAAWVLALVYAAVAITIVSGLDYFRGFLRRQPAGETR
jgi:CDP-diacylglycerol---glycerol-3-phosphate 3-phosphatidyltransferase